jgi:hypothetical protein
MIIGRADTCPTLGPHRHNALAARAIWIIHATQSYSFGAYRNAITPKCCLLFVDNAPKRVQGLNGRLHPINVSQPHGLSRPSCLESTGRSGCPRETPQVVQLRGAILVCVVLDRFRLKYSSVRPRVFSALRRVYDNRLSSWGLGLLVHLCVYAMWPPVVSPDISGTALQTPQKTKPRLSFRRPQAFDPSDDAGYAI